MNRFFALLAMAVTLFAAAPLRAAGITGAWTRGIEASNIQTKTPVQFRLTLVGDRLEGEMSGEARQGKITGQVRLTRVRP